ncbi:MAG TPA: ATP-binding protein [Candidatus Limnocylindrales bacterium]|nr:ATP-binding protein [Candidatus Limnocylindrales bacterium]
MTRPRLNRLARVLAVALGSMALATVAVGFLQDVLHVPNPSAVYLIAVVATAFVGGTFGAIITSVAAFLLYDFLFIEPRFTLTVSRPEEWLGVVILLFVGIVVGQLAAIQRARAEEAEAREREARALFRLSRALATRPSTAAILPEIARDLADDARFARAWIALGPDDASERVAADTQATPPPSPGIVHVLRRMPGEVPAMWVRVHQPRSKTRTAGQLDAFRVRIEAGDRALGSIWALRSRDLDLPSRTETRLLAAAADQVGQALAQDQLAAESQAAEIARESDALKSALLQSVSHDLRTPLASIRAAAGSLRPGAGMSLADQQESADAIDREVEYLNRLVTNLLDLSRIEAGALRAERDVFELDDLVGRTLDRVGARLAPRPVDVRLGAPPVVVDPIFLDEAVTNVLENIVKYTPADAPVRITAGATGDRVRLTIEDGGRGVPIEALDRLFEKFYRVPGHDRGSRSGTGIGLAVVRGLTEAMGGTVTARASELGGLAIDFDLPLARAEAPAAVAA